MNASRIIRTAQLPLRSAVAGRRQASTISVLSTTSSATALPLSNVEAQWEKLTHEEQAGVHRQLEDLQKRDWKALTLDEKKAGGLLFIFHPV